MTGVLPRIPNLASFAIIAICLFAFASQSPAALVTHAFRPSTAYPAITTFDSFQFAYTDPAQQPRDQLVLFLPGTRGASVGYREYLKNAAGLGFHSLGLNYVNYFGINELCNTNDPANPNCHAQTRLEVIDGTERSPLVDVDRTNSIEHRLITSLQYLDAAFPAEGWGQYLDGTTILWEKIVVAGHSQGAGHAVLIARDHLVARCLNFAGVDWWAAGAQVAPWLSEPFATPVDRIYILGHLRDESVDFTLLQLYADAVDVTRYGGFVTPETESDPHFGHTHFLATDLEPVRPLPDGRYHATMITDLDTPFQADGVTPVLKPAWDYMLLAPTNPFRVEKDAAEMRVYFSPGTLYESQNLVDWTAVPSADSPLVIPLVSVPVRYFLSLESAPLPAQGAQTTALNEADSLAYTSASGLPPYRVIEVSPGATSTNMRAQLQDAIDHENYDIVGGIVVKLLPGEYRMWLRSTDPNLIAALHKNETTGADVIGQEQGLELYALQITRDNTIIHGAGTALTTLSVYGIDNNDPTTPPGWAEWVWPRGKLSWEITTIQEAAKSAHAGGTYWTFSVPVLNPNPPVDYYLWYDLTGSGTDPAPAGKTGIRADISGVTDAEDVAAAVAAAINTAVTQPGPDAPLAGVAGSIITLANAVGGNVTDAANVDSGVGAITVVRDGTKKGITRGGGILMGKLSGATTYTARNFQLHDLTLTGNTPHSGVATTVWPPLQADGKGWGLAEKAVYNNVESGGSVFENVIFEKWSGEIIYRSRNSDGLWTFDNCVFRESDSVPLSLNASCVIDGCTVGQNCFDSLESWQSEPGRSMTARNSTFYGGPAINGKDDTQHLFENCTFLVDTADKLQNDGPRFSAGSHNVTFRNNTIVTNETRAIYIKSTEPARNLGPNGENGGLDKVAHFSNFVIEDNTITHTAPAPQSIELWSHNFNTAHGLIIRNNTITGSFDRVLREKWQSDQLDYTHDPGPPGFEDVRWDHVDADHAIYIYGNSTPAIEVYTVYGTEPFPKPPVYGPPP